MYLASQGAASLFGIAPLARHSEVPLRLGEAAGMDLAPQDDWMVGAVTDLAPQDAGPLFQIGPQAMLSEVPRVLAEAEEVRYLASQGAAPLFGLVSLARLMGVPRLPGEAAVLDLASQDAWMKRGPGRSVPRT